MKHAIFSFSFLLTTSLGRVYALLSISSKTLNRHISRISRISRLSSHLDDVDDPYGDMLNLNRGVESKVAEDLVNLWSIEKKGDEKLVFSRMTAEKKVKPWFWDDFMEEEFGDMDAELTEDQSWMSEVRSITEQKRGMAIWSKKSEKELQRELKKSLAAKSVNIPDSVYMVISAVYLEKTHTMKQMKKYHEMAALDFRKWMIEQSKKTKKEPVTPAKVAVSKKWLSVHPNRSLGYSRKTDKPPPIVMDEKSADMYGIPSAEGSVFGSPKSSSMENTLGSGSMSANGIAGQGSVSSISGGNKNGPVVTTAMIHWDQALTELPASMTIDDTEYGIKRRRQLMMSSRISDGNKGVFYVDGDEMYVPNTLIALLDKGDSKESKTGNDFESIQVPTTALMTTDKIESTTATEVTADDMFVDDFYVVI